MYAKYLKYIKNPICVSRAKEIVKHFKAHSDGTDNNSKYSVKNVLLELFVDKYANHDSFDPDTCILMDFPFDMQVELACNSIMAHNSSLYAISNIEQPPIDLFEANKLIYNLWKYRDDNKKLDTCCKNIILQLNRFKIFTEDELQHIEGRFTLYYAYDLFGFIPLMENEGLDIVDIVHKMHYSDAQDLLMFGLYQYEPSKFYNKLKEILIYWENNKNIGLCEGTDIFQQLKIIADKYKIAGYDLINDPDLIFLKGYLE